MFGDPLGGLLFGGETLDYFRLAIGPKNIDHPAKSGITFSRHESGSVFGHLANMRLRRAGSSRSFDNNYMTVSEPQARVTLPGSQLRLPRAGNRNSGGRGTPYGVTHTHFALVSRSAPVSKSRRCCKQNIRLAVASFWRFDC
jgi:hypothetical protein